MDSWETRQFIEYCEYSTVKIKEKFSQKGLCQCLYDIIKYSTDETLIKATEKIITNFIKVGYDNEQDRYGTRIVYYIDAREVPQEIVTEIRTKHKTTMRAYKEKVKKEKLEKEGAKRLDTKAKSEEVLNLLRPSLSANEIDKPSKSRPANEFEEDEENLPNIEDQM